MMKGHSFSGVSRSCGEYDDLSRDDEEEFIRDIGVKAGLSSRQRRSAITDSDQTRLKKSNCKKRFREEVQALVPAKTSRMESSRVLNRRGHARVRTYTGLSEKWLRDEVEHRGLRLGKKGVHTHEISAHTRD